MFHLRRPTPAASRQLLRRAQTAALFPLDLLDLREGLKRPLPQGMVHDLSRSVLGVGPATFARACDAFRRWQAFNLGWVHVSNQDTPIALEQTVGVEARTLGLWSSNFSRITQVIDTGDAFGFLYTTTTLHVEEGQERFLLEFCATTGHVGYLLEAVSRPAHWLARLGQPFARAMQHRFARDSHARLRRAVQEVAPAHKAPKGTSE